jgi:hypothetical protein
MKTNFTLLFYLKKPKNHQNGVVPIYLRITVNEKPVQAVSANPPYGTVPQDGLKEQKKKSNPLTPTSITSKPRFIKRMAN